MKKALIHILLCLGVAVTACGQRTSKKTDSLIPKDSMQHADLLCSVNQNNLWGFADTSGTIVIPCSYASLSDYEIPHFRGGMAIVYENQSKLAGVIGPKGNWMIPASFSEIFPFSENLALVRKKSAGHTNTFIDPKGEERSFPEYDNISPFTDGIAWATKNKLSGLIDKNGKAISPLIYHNDMGIFSEGYIAVDGGDQSDEKGDRVSLYGYIDRTGKIVIPLQYRFAFSFYNQRAIVSDGKGKYGAIDPQGNLKVPYRFIFPAESNLFKGGIAFAHDYDAYQKGDMRLGLLGADGKWIIEPVFDRILPFSENLAATSQKGKWGYIDTKGQWVISPVYEMAHPFSENLAAVLVDGKWGFIDHTGNLVVKAVYEETAAFSHGLAAIKQKGKYGFINQKGELKIPAIYDKVGNFHDIKTGR